MTKFDASAKLEATVTVTLSEKAARALDHLQKWGEKSFITNSGNSIGSSFKDHQAGLEEFFKAIHDDLPPIIRRLDDSRAVFSGRKIAVEPKKDEPL